MSHRIADVVKREQIRLSHVDHATTSRRTQNLIEHLLQRVNQIASQELKIILPPGTGSGQYRSFETGQPAVLRFGTPFYYRQVGHPFHVVMRADRSRLMNQEILSFSYALPESVSIRPSMEALSMAELADDGHLEWTVTGSEIGASGKIQVSCGPYSAMCEVVIAENAAGKGYGNPSGKPRKPWAMDNTTDLFRGYALKNLNNDVDRAVYSIEDRMILINTEAPTVRLYLNGQGHFKDGARLLLAELFLDVITEELARRYVDRTTHKGESEAYKQAKQDLVRRYGVEIHSILLGA